MLLAGWSNTQPDLSRFSLMFHSLIQTQKTIDWFALSKDFWSTEWNKLNIFFTPQTQSKIDSKMWSEPVLALLWSKILDFWEIRNKHNHGCDSARKSYLLRERTISKFIYLYSLRSQVCSDDQTFFSQDFNTLASASTSTIQVWIRIYGPLIKLSMKQLKQNTKTRDIRSYFTWRRN